MYVYYNYKLRKNELIITFTHRVIITKLCYMLGKFNLIFRTYFLMSKIR